MPVDKSVTRYEPAPVSSGREEGKMMDTDGDDVKMDDFDEGMENESARMLNKDHDVYKSQVKHIMLDEDA